MRPLVTTLLLLSLTACVGVLEKQPAPARDTKSYPQDQEQCMAQPELVWCQRACDIDDNAYGWCDDG